uniref:Uncharacterized protein n=1 Tax=Oryza sativa subsp. japonica TaxID=39947 RepID=Q2R9S3_ORYSJ|nr:hypothetical protein LOC_Os11g07760 [Oryza sativa Japonica Group]
MGCMMADMASLAPLAPSDEGKAGEGAIGEGGNIIVEIRRDLKHCVKENDREDDKKLYKTIVGKIFML